MKPNDFRNQNAGKAIRTQTGYWAFLPAPLPPIIEWRTALVSALSEAERELSKLTTLAGNFLFPKLLTQPFVRQEAVLSSRIEGTRASLVDLYNYESAQLSFLELDDDVREVRAGFECGVGLGSFDGFETGDIIEFFVMERVN